MFGGKLITLGANCIIIEQSLPEERTMRMQVFATSTLIFALVAAAGSIPILTTYGFQWIFGLSAAAHIVGLVLIPILIDEEERKQEKTDWQETWEKLRGIFKPRANISVAWAMVLCGALFSTSFTSELALTTYFYQQKFGMKIEETTVFGSFLIPILLTRIFKMSDFGIGIFSTTMNLSASLALPFAQTRLGLYLASVLNVMKITLFSLPNAIISKIVHQDEIGRFLGMGAILGIFIPFGMNYIYNVVFHKTSDTMIGAFFFVSAAAHIFILLLFGVSRCLYVKPLNTPECDEIIPENIVNIDISYQEYNNPRE